MKFGYSSLSLLLLLGLFVVAVVVATDSSTTFGDHHPNVVSILPDGSTTTIEIDTTRSADDTTKLADDSSSSLEQQQTTTPLSAAAAAAAATASESGSTDTTNTSSSTTTDEEEAGNDEQYHDDEEAAYNENKEDYDEEGYDDEEYDGEEVDDGDEHIDVWEGLEKGVIPPLPDIDADGYITVVYGKEQHITSSQDEKEYQNTIERMKATHNYMYGTVYTDLPMNLQKDCKLRDELCTYWATIGECDANPAYMKVQCAPACYTCDQLLYEVRCPIPSNLTDGNVWQGGSNNEMNKMFTNIITNPYYTETYGPITIISQPSVKQQQPTTDEGTTSEDRILVEYEDDAPWLITIDDFVTEEECLTLIELGAQEGYKRSEDVGEKLFDGTYAGVQSTGRTSTNAWCGDSCYTNTTSLQVIQKLENLTGISDSNAEHLQLLRYEVGQFYESHHDYIDHDVDRPQGVRILTVYLYLNDVAEGGGTNFPNIGQTVMPKRGRVVIWPSVFNDRPNDEDKRTTHQALPVIKGIKYGANAWVHMRDFKTPHNKSCT